LNLLLDVGFNKEVGQDSALYWSKRDGDLAALIDKADQMSDEEIKKYDLQSTDRIRDAYSWQFIADEYEKVWM
ncbi:glycosyl transferase, partial [Lactobacillus delbrueckii subsp. lactis]